MRFKGKPIFEIRVPRSGLTFDDCFAWREAAHWAGGGSVNYWQEFCALDSDEQSAIVAHWMARMQIDGVIAKDLEEQRKRAERRSRRKG